MKIPFFSVVIPVYNRSDKILPILESVLSQTFDSWEALIVDDGSRDGEQLKNLVLSLSDDRFRYIHRENGGGGAARNTGIDNAIGQYIAFLDSDDLFREDKLDAYYQAIADSDKERCLFWSKFIVDRGEDNTWIKPPRAPKNGERIDEYLTCGPGWIQTSTVAIKTSLAKEIRFDESLPFSQDTDFVIRCFLNKVDFVCLEDCYSTMNDVYDPSRVSKQKKVEPILNWVERMKKQGLSKRSYLGYRGWQCARIVSEYDLIKAFSYYFPAIFARAYDLHTTIRVFAQIVLPQKRYQSLMNVIVKFFGKKNQAGK